uniref:Condensin complex subunit 1 n=1 Tax=Ascaris suum TaxID=6253 RepID=F1KR65_ASCSU
MEEEEYTGTRHLKDFLIPLRDDDLLEENSDFYTVEIRPSLEAIVSEVFAFQRDTNSEQWQRIVDHFDYFFFTIKHISEGEPWRLRAQLMHALIRGLNQTVDSLEELLALLMGDAEEAASAGNAEQRKIHARAFQMYVYLLCRLSDLFETEAVNRQKNMAFFGARRGRKAVLERGEDEFMDRWVAERQKVLTAIQRALSLCGTDAEGKRRRAAIKYIWEPAIVCPNFMRMVKDLAYKFLENPELGKFSGREWLRMIFEYLRVICINFEEFSKVGSKLVGLMKRLDYLSAASQTQSPFVDAIEAASENGDMDPLFMSMLTSFARLTTSDFSKTDVSARPFALFITSLAEKKPRLLNRHIVNIAFFLSNDPVTLRSAVLTAFVEIVVEVYKGNLPEGSHRRARDRLLLRLQDHIVDVNAVVRSRALQLWTRLARSAQIPLAFIHNGLIRDAGCRLMDKSVYVRKNAAIFLATFLEFNPFGPSLSADDLASELNRLKAERLQLKKNNPEYDSVKAAMNEWATIKNEITDCVNERIEIVQSDKRRRRRVDGDDDERAERESGTSSADGFVRVASTGLNPGLLRQLKKDGMEVDVKEAIININDLVMNIPDEEIMGVVLQLLSKKESRRAAAEMFTHATLLNKIPLESDGSKDEVAARILEALGTHFIEASVSRRLNNDEEMLEEEDRVEDFTRRLRAVDNRISYCQEALMFSLEMEKCLSSALRSIMNGQANELVESIHLIVEARKFSIRGSEKAVRELFRVVWRRDSAVRETVVKAGYDLFISANPDPNVAVRKSAENLIKIILGVCEEDRVSLEQVICLMARENMLNVQLLDALSSVVFSTQGAVRVAALRLFSIICRANKGFMRERLEFFVEMSRREAFFEGDNGTLAAEYFNAISMLGGLPNARDLATLSERPFRLPESHRIIRCIETLLIENASNRHYEWLCVMNKAINALFYTAARPSLSVRRIASNIVRQAKHALASFWISKQQIEAVANASFKDVNDEAELDPEVEDLIAKEEHWLEEWNSGDGDECMEVDENDRETNKLDDETLAQIKRLFDKTLNAEAENRFAVWETIAERVCAFTGQVALKVLIHVDISFLAEMKRKNELVHAMRQAASRSAEPLMKGKPLDAEDYPQDRMPTKLEKESMERIGFFEENEQDSEDRLGLTGISEEERLAQRTQRICETGVFRRGKLLSRLTPFLLFVLKSRKTVCSERLRSAAALALSKVMLLSMHVCVHMMPIFVHFLAHSPSAECRSNLMVAAGDLCFRFPNVVEKHSFHLYERIRDKDVYVRETCVIVLAHLILNDMVKVRGTVADLARCTIDANPSIANLAKYFFVELSKKGNVIYNLMPDMISRLSSNEEVTTEDFGQIMKLLLSFIKKDKQADSLLEKLCQRMQSAIDQSGKLDARLAECLSYCISRLPLSEKSLRIMSDLLPSYAYLLSLDTVFANLSAAMMHFRKTTALRNTELKAELDEFLEVLTKMHNEKMEQEAVAERGLLHKKKTRKSPLKMKSPKK